MATTSERVDLRMDAEVKELWERGAAIAGVSLAAFIKMAASERASALINSHALLTLTPEESAWFLDFLRQPAAAPTPAMERAAALHRELLGTEQG